MELSTLFIFQWRESFLPKTTSCICNTEEELWLCGTVFTSLVKQVAKKKKLLWEKELAEDLSFLGISANLSGHFLLKLSRHAKL